MDTLTGTGAPAEELTFGLLDGLRAETIAAIERAVREERFEPGGVIFREGDVGTDLGIIQSGLVDVAVENADVRQRIATLGPGETVGEQSLLTGHRRSATTIAQTPVTLWRLDFADFVELLAEHADLGARVARILSGRVTTTGPRTRGQTVACCAPSTMATAATARAIVASCTEMLHAPPVVLAGGDASDWGESLPAGATIVALTDIAGAAVRSVRTSPLVLLLFGREVPHPVVDGADRVVALDGVNVVGAHNDGRVIVATTPADESAAAQLARRICRRTVGLALGSGALRGFAHAGVLATFEQRGVPIDFMSGASAGSIAGSLYLTGTRPDDLARLATLARGPLAGGLPRVALSPQSVLPGRRLRAFLRSRLRETSFEDLTTPFTVAATDLVTRRAHYIENGSLVDAVAASSAVPGLFPPVLVGGTRMVDGGSSDPVPVGRLRERGADIVVAVNVMRLGNDLLGMKLPRLPIPLPLPAVITNLLVGLDSLMVEIASHTCKHADVTIEPTLAHARWYDVLGVMDYRDAGAEAAEAAIPRIRRLVGALAA